MALATEQDVENALGRSLTEAEDVTTLLEEASDLVVGYLRHEPDPVPGPVARAVATMVAAVLTKPAVSTSDYGVNGYNVIKESMAVKVGIESATTTGPWLSNSLKRRISRYRRLDSFTMTSERRQTVVDEDDETES